MSPQSFIFNIRIAANYDKTPAQILIRWVIEPGFIVSPEYIKKERIIENSGILDSSISDEEMETLNGLNEN
ncbi:MAG: aldo/keto reductase [Candidatus Marinimicrobia bacterium]|nr:aldo/keto reductase [Candidatus Neomarinimicrobiota bacterium]